MIQSIEIIPTIVAQNTEEIQAGIVMSRAFGNVLHIDVDDGIFTPQISWPYEGKGKLGQGNGGLDTPVDNFLIQAHLMVSEPREVGEFFASQGAHTLIAHIESTSLSTDIFDAWRAHGVQEIGLAILLDTAIEDLSPLLPSCDFIHVLSVATIGSQGAPFDPRAITKVEALTARFPSVPISVDGGVSADTIIALVKAGARRFAVGSALSTASNPQASYQELMTLAQSALQ
jgi:ribulose-phosphate 3-epimerase